MKKTLTTLITLTILILLLTQCGKDDDRQPQEITINKEGGRFEITDKNSPIYGAYVEVPQGALNRSAAISIQDVTNDLKITGDSTSIKLNFEPHGITFEEPVEIGLPVAPEIDIDNASVYYYDILNSTRVDIPIKEIDRTNNRIIAETNHFSAYGASDKGIKCQFQLQRYKNSLVVTQLIAKPINGNRWIFGDYSWISGPSKRISEIPLKTEITGTSAFDLIKMPQTEAYFKLRLKKNVSFWKDQVIRERNFYVSKSDDDPNTVEIFEDGELVQEINYAFESNDDNIFNQRSYSSYFAGNYIHTVFDDVKFDESSEYYVDLEWQIKGDNQNHRTLRYEFSGYNGDFVKAFSKLEEIGNIEGRVALTRYPVLKIKPVTEITYDYVRLQSYFVLKGIERDGLAYRFYTTPDLSGDYKYSLTIGNTTESPDTKMNIKEVERGTYYVVVVNTNTNKTCSNVVQFTTPELTIPVVKAEAATDIKPNNATLNGVVESQGGSAITERGFYWGTDENNLDTRIKVSTNGVGQFNHRIRELQPGTSYYYRAFAANNFGEAKSEEVKQLKTAGLDISVQTKAATEIGEISAMLNGEFINSGGYDILDMGFLWGMSSGDLNNRKTVGKIEGAFSGQIIELSTNTTYYYRAYAHTSAGSAEGEVLSFKTGGTTNTPPTAPQLIAPVNSATDVELNPTFSWTASEDADGDNIQYTLEVVDSELNNWKSFNTYNTSARMELDPAIDYLWFVRAKDGRGGNTPSEVREFTTKSNGSGGDNETGTYTDPRDNKTYKTVKIGNQTWLAENLVYLPKVSRPSAESYTEPHYYVYGYNGTNVSEAKATDFYSTYGVLYNWPAAKAACPPGWHLPTDDEWKQLEMTIGLSQSEADDTGWRGTYEGKKLKATSGWDNNGNGTDDFGFSALPRGYLNTDGWVYYVHESGYWWSATERNSNTVWRRHVSYGTTEVHRFYYGKAYGFSVRCVRD